MKTTFRNLRLEHFDPASSSCLAEVYLLLQDAMCHLAVEDDTFLSGHFPGYSLRNDRLPFDILYKAKCKVAKELKKAL